VIYDDKPNLEISAGTYHGIYSVEPVL